MTIYIYIYINKTQKYILVYLCVALYVAVFARKRIKLLNL